MNRWFPATNRNSLKNSLPFFEKLKKIFRLLQAIFDLTNFFWQNKFTIVTISASQIAPERENDTRHTPGKIQKTKPLESRYQHLCLRYEIRQNMFENKILIFFRD